MQVRRSWAAIAAIVLAGCGGGGQPAASANTTMPGSAAIPGNNDVTGSIDLGRYSLFYSCSGTGSPTVLLEHGLGGDAGQWTEVVREVSKRTRVCDYSRVNAHLSGTATGIHTVADNVADVHELLAKAGIAGPYVVVGYSWGGLVAQAFASTYPAEVKAMVLVDSNNAKEADTYWAHLTPAQVAQDRTELAAPNPESVDILASFDEVKALASVPAVPLVVVTHTASDPMEWPEGWDQQTFDALQSGLQKDLLKLTTTSSQVLVDGGHDIPEAHPEAIVDAIETVLEAIAAT